MNRRRRLLELWPAAFLLLAPPGPSLASEIIGSAFLEQDGSLRISSQKIPLYGIYIPPTEQSCHAFVRPMPCASRAVLALDFRISGNFVHCIPHALDPDGSLVARCSVDQEDLSAWMLQHGWAVARPDAPFDYAALRIAQGKGIGIGGIPIDNFPHPGVRK